MSAEAAKNENHFISAFRDVTERHANEPAWLRQLREDAFRQFQQSGFPKVEEEEWKYTNVSAIAKGDFNPLRNGHSFTNEALSTFTYREAPTRFVFLNGRFQPDLSSTDALPSGLVAIDLHEALADEYFESIVRQSIERDGGAGVNGFVSLNDALFSDGLLLQISRDVTIESPLHLLFLAQANNGDKPAALPRVVLHAEANSSATIIETYASASDGAYLTNGIIDIDLADGARIQHYKVQRESPAGFHIATTRAALGASAKYDTTSINLGAALSRHNIEVVMDHEGAECSVDGLYMIEGTQHTDTHSVIDHASANCASRQLYKGILDGKSRGVFNGKVFVRHGAQHTDAQQTNKNLLLSEQAQIDTKPQLEIYADDVKCTHGAAVGQLDDDERFYLESRGLNPTLARNLLTYGFAEEVIERIKIDSIKRELDAAVLNRLKTQLEE